MDLVGSIDSMRMQCRCIEKIYRNFVSASPIPLLSVSNAWNTINDAHLFGELNEHILRSARDSCFMIRFTAGTFQAFAQAIQNRGAKAYWIIKAYRGQDFYVFGSSIEVRHGRETVARFSTVCDISHSYIQSRSSFDTPLVCDNYIAEFADKRAGAPALISWSPRCTVFRAIVQNLNNTRRSLASRPFTNPSSPSSPSRAMVSKGTLVLTPRSSKSQPSPLQSPSKIHLPKPYTYKYLLCARPSSFEQIPDCSNLMSQSDSKDGEEVHRPVFPVSCRMMVDEYSYYSSIYCISSSYMFSSIDILRKLLSHSVLDDISDLMGPIAGEAQDFEISFTDPENASTNTNTSTSTSTYIDVDNSSEDDIDGDDGGKEPPLKHREGECSDQALSDESLSESNKAMQMAEEILNRIENEGNMILEADDKDRRDTNDLIPIGEEIEHNAEETATSRYIRSMPLHYPLLAIPCPDSKPHDSGQHLLKPSPSSAPKLGRQRSSDPSKVPCNNQFEKIEDLVAYLCSLVVAGKMCRK